MKKVLVYLLLFVNSSVLAQLQITFPMNRAVFQRNNAGEGAIPVAGTFQTRVDRIDARLVSIRGGESVGWTNISFNLSAGSFSGNIHAKGGWYFLEVRAIRNQEVITTASIEKVGLGEVFVIAGQSNAQGYDGFGSVASDDDRVNVISNYYSAHGQFPDVPYPAIDRLNASSKIAPDGISSWCWGRLGDLLTAKLDVPVMFFNAGMESLGVEEWKVSADGGRGRDFYSGNYALPGYPYNSLRSSLYNYVNMFGVRAVLWHQGETDSDKGTTFDVYRETLQYVIQHSRTDSGRDISWVVSKVSRTNFKTSSPDIIQAQNAVIQNYPNVFNGPDTDSISDRVDGVHFNSQGLLQLANAWNDRLNTDFFSRSNPSFGASLLNFSANCDANNVNAPLHVSIQDGFRDYRWTDGTNILNSSRSTQVKEGFFRGKALDNLGNVYYTVGVRYSSDVIPQKPQIVAETATSFCEGGTVKLNSSVAEEFFWNTGATGQSVVVSQSGAYTISKFNFLGCTVISDATNVTVFPKPEARIIAEGPTTFCEENTVTLRSATASGNLWNTGQSTSAITVGRSGEFTVNVRNEFGCERISDKVVVTVNPKPQRPNLTVNGPTVFCADASVNISTDAESGVIWNTGATSPQLTVNQTGDYFATATNQFGCQRASSPVSIRVNPLPPQPTITASGPTAFCEGGSVSLTAPLSIGYIWNNTSTEQSISTSTAGVFSVKVRDENGCISPLSSEVAIIVRENPQGVSIHQSGPYTLETLTTGTIGSEFEWARDGVKLTDVNRLIKVRQSGAYTVRGSINYNIGGNVFLRCYSNVSAPFNYTINPSESGTVVFPNPVSDDVINIETLNDYQNVNITFLTLKGEKVARFFVSSLNTRQTLLLRDLPKGSYVVKIENSQLSVTKRIIIQ